MYRPASGSRWWMSATRPATEFSIGIMASSRLAALHRGKRVLEGRAGQRLHVRIGVAAGEMRVGARLALKAILLRGAWSGLRACQLSAAVEAMLARPLESAGVSTPSGTVSTRPTSMRMPASSARSCSSFSRCLQRRRRQRHEALQRRAAVGIDADVMIERALAVRRGGAGEIERAQPSWRPSGVPTTFTTLGSVRSSSRVISAAMVAISAACPRAARGRRGRARDRASAGRPAD